MSPKGKGVARNSTEPSLWPPPLATWAVPRKGVRVARGPGSERSACLARSCHPMSGECSCQPGWAGLHCNESCPLDTHGPGCREHCLCLHGGLCQPDSGLCRCAPGYTVRRAPRTGRGWAGREERGAGGRGGPPLTRAPAAGRARTALASVRPTLTDSTAPLAAPARMPSPAPLSTAPASARKVMGCVRERRFGGGAPERREAAGSGRSCWAAAGPWESSQASSFLESPLCFFFSCRNPPPP